MVMGITARCGAGTAVCGIGTVQCSLNDAVVPRRMRGTGWDEVMMGIFRFVIS
jgi:hypothetical protein